MVGWTVVVVGLTVVVVWTVVDTASVKLKETPTVLPVEHETIVACCPIVPSGNGSVDPLKEPSPVVRKCFAVSADPLGVDPRKTTKSPLTSAGEHPVPENLMTLPAGPCAGVKLYSAPVVWALATGAKMRTDATAAVRANSTLRIPIGISFVRSSE